MCRLRNIAMECDRRTDRQTDDGQSDPYVSLCFTGDTKTQRLTKLLTDRWISSIHKSELLCNPAKKWRVKSMMLIVPSIVQVFEKLVRLKVKDNCLNRIYNSITCPCFV